MIEALGGHTADWEPIVVFVLVNKLDVQSQQSWKETLKASKELTKLDQFLFWNFWKYVPE